MIGGGQWFDMHVPFQRVTDFTQMDGLDRVPPSMRYFAMAIHCDGPEARAVWQDDKGPLQEDRNVCNGDVGHLKKELFQIIQLEL